MRLTASESILPAPPAASGAEHCPASPPCRYRLFTSASTTRLRQTVLDQSRNRGNPVESCSIAFCTSWRFLFFTFDIHLPAEQLGLPGDILPFFPMASESRESSTMTSMWCSTGLDDRNAADFRRGPRRVWQNVDLRSSENSITSGIFAAQFDNNRLHPHSLHADAGAHRCRHPGHGWKRRSWWRPVSRAQPRMVTVPS